MNTIKINNTKVYYFLSLALHVTGLLALVMNLDFSSETPTVGDPSVRLVNSYIYASDSMQTSAQTAAREVQSRTEAKSLPAKKMDAGITIQKAARRVIKSEKKAPAANDAVNQAAQHSVSAKSSNGAPTEELLAFLHAAIQKQQRYPESAMQMERQGRATVKFMLFTDGSINNVRISKSSGTESLDNAALAAVRDAAPFQGVDKYMTDAGEFSIDVVFELS